MSGQSFANIELVPIREVWPHEEYDFTPWLAANLDRISELINLPLVLVETESRVGSYRSDIVARESQRDRVVVIENQFGGSDHDHLGKLMTYAVDKNANFAVWVAERFSQSHLQTLEGINSQPGARFFAYAVAVKVLRIGSSDPVPVFELMPTGTQESRVLNEVTRSSTNRPRAVSSRSGVDPDYCEDVWTTYVAKYPAELKYDEPRRKPNFYHRLPEIGLDVSLFIGAGRVGLYVKAEDGADKTLLKERLEAHAEQLEARLGAIVQPKKDRPFYFHQDRPADLTQSSLRREALEWLFEKATLYTQILLEVMT